MKKHCCEKKDRTLTEEEVLRLLVDVTEQSVRRPQKAKKRKKKTYSEKKKRHTSKVEIIMTAAGKILSLSPTHPERKNDFRIRKEKNPLHRAAEKYVDLGYQGLQKRTSFLVLSFRRKKNQPLTAEQKNHNRQQASFRIKVKHKIRELKVFKILSETYRNFGKKQH